MELHASNCIDEFNTNVALLQINSKFVLYSFIIVENKNMMYFSANTLVYHYKYVFWILWKKNQRFDIYPEYLKMIYYTIFEKNLTTLVAMVAIKLEISMTRRHMESTRHYPVHPPTPPCSHKGLVHGHKLSTPICPMPTGLPIPEIRVFQTLTLKLQRQGHGCGQRTRLYCQSII